MLELIWLLLPVAAASGWWLAKRDSEKPGGSRPTATNADYFTGLNYLLDDKPDQALDVFVRMAEMDRDTVETHLTLGNLFRRRGEVDRAIHIHHNLTTRADLTIRQKHRAILELAEDYMRAGLLDRAEALYQSLIEQAEQSEYIATALQHLMAIYEQEKDWLQALKYCDLLEQMTGQVRKTAAAHYCCELAEYAHQHGDLKTALNHLQNALGHDANCARASILGGEIALAQGHYADAIQAFKMVERQNPVFFPEVLPALQHCYQARARESELITYLQATYNRHPSGLLSAALAQLIAQCDGVDKALQFLEQELKQQPSLLALRCLIELKLANADADTPSELDTLYRSSRRMLDGAARYRCDNCGFTIKSLHWHCPRCQRWESIRPLRDLMWRNEV